MLSVSTSPGSVVMFWSMSTSEYTVLFFAMVVLSPITTPTRLLAWVYSLCWSRASEKFLCIVTFLPRMESKSSHEWMCELLLIMLCWITEFFSITAPCSMLTGPITRVLSPIRTPSPM